MALTSTHCRRQRSPIGRATKSGSSHHQDLELKAVSFACPGGLSLWYFFKTHEQQLFVEVKHSLN
jgi:hypothetical protein